MIFARSGRAAAPAVVSLLLAAAVLVPGASPASAKQPPTKHIGPVGRSGQKLPPGKSLTHTKLAKPAPARAPDRLIVKYRSDANSATRNAIRSSNKVAKVRNLGPIQAEVVRPSAGQSVESAAAALRRDRRVVYAVPDYYRQVTADPTAEEFFGYQWGLENTGQVIDGYAGQVNVDIDAREGFGVTQGSENVTVAVIDDGVDFTHPDLVGQAWVNPGEIPGNGLDDDGNGLADDVNGWDFCNGDSSVHDMDEDFHGTGVAGVIAASTNGQGITGVAPGVRVMALKFLDPNNPACSTDDLAISAIGYAKEHGAQIINASWGGPGYDPALEDAITASGLLFVAAAGNGDGTIGDNIDLHPFYPASYPSANILTVASINNRGLLSDWSNYGTTSVDLSAPGEAIALPSAETSIHAAGWILDDGTSYAAPHAAGVAALIGSVRPDFLASATALRQRVLDEAWRLDSTVGLTTDGTVLDSMLSVDFVGPVAVAPSVSILSPTMLGTSTVSVRIASPQPTDVTSGVCDDLLQRSANGGGWSSVAGSTSATQALSIGATYQFRLRATDCAGNNTYEPANSFRPLRIQENAASTTYRGRWTTSFVSGASGSRTKYATRSTASATFRFTGRSVGLVMPKSRSRGSFRVYVDEAYVKTISLYSRTTKARQVVFSRSWPANGAHSVKVVPVGTRGHPRVDIDAFVILR